MIVPGSANALMLGQSQGYNLTKSLRFRSSASAYLNRTPASSSSRTTWTYSAWIKFSVTTSASYNISLFGADNGTDTSLIAFTSSPNTPNFQMNIYNGNGAVIRTTQYFRDPSAWYHIVVVSDTTNATASNRTRLYVNGVQVTAFDSATYPSQNGTGSINSTTQHDIGRQSGTTRYFDGYMAEVNFIDGQALTPSSFGSTNALTGVWQPAKYTGTYGTNGFYLPFTNTTSTTTLGYDFSGNSNNWTTNNLSLTAGSTYDSMTDVPTLTSATTANYPTWNPLENTGTLANGNLNTSSSTSSSAYATMWIPQGKFYFENTIITKPSGANTYIGTTRSALYVYNSNGNFFNNGSYIAYGATYTTNDVIGCAIDTVNGTMEFFKNGTSQGQKTGLSFGSEVQFTVAATTGASTGSVSTNFGQQPWQYSPPTGFVALNTYNLPTSTIVKGNTVMDATLWAGDGTNGRAITNAGSFQPDLVWAKARSSAIDNWITDSVRGASKQLSSNLTDAEATYNLLSSFNSNGFSVNGGTYTGTNQNGTTYVGWQWKASGSTVSNTSGSITSTVSVNATAGFSIVTYTGTGSNATVGHGLGVAPSMVIVKSRSDASTYWCVYQKAMWQTSGTDYTLLLPLTNAAASRPTLFNSTQPSSTVFSIGTNGGVNNSGSTYVAYCWAEVAGFSKFGSYTGNGSTDGPFVYCGFRPKYVMTKRTDSTSNWYIQDTSRSTYNVQKAVLVAEAATAETADGGLDFLSNGFKLRNIDSSENASGGTYIYMAFAENPFKNALAR